MPDGRRSGTARTSPPATLSSAAEGTTGTSHARVLLNACSRDRLVLAYDMLTQLAPSGCGRLVAANSTAGGPVHPSGPPHAVLRLAFLFASPRPTDARANQPKPDTRSPQRPTPTGFASVTCKTPDPRNHYTIPGTFFSWDFSESST